ncbi:hypothetical protein LOC68_27700 [Blastopirellula sp. JC732]|uniref:Uncharacterized protein n=1 Tax=Blastopirellula sediminis TaxID=2894196 RepID=A0A9X1MU93_9BACT|nr:hypothetical protein [Blastopirellula sediminis]MCC9604504.1 hypothetical protein [Blastopirellula sediminis]MCC9632197.1 hypothetical protein [Blastopirellula sediminis]
MLSFQLDCGRSVFLDSLKYSRTYSGLLEGRPTARLNYTIIDRTRSQTASRAFVIPPRINDEDPDHPVLPPVQLVAYVWCSEPIGSEAMASQAWIVWYREEWKDESIEKVAFDGIRGVDWDAIAEDFDW